MPSPTIAKIVATAYGYQTDNVGRRIDLYRWDGNAATVVAVHVAMIESNGEIIPFGDGYTRADHECAMAIRATMAFK